MSVKTSKPNLFAIAKKVDSKKENKSKILSLPVPKELQDHHDSYIDSKGKLEVLESKYQIAETAIKSKVPEIFLNEYRSQGRNIGSFKLGQITISVQDKYQKLSEDSGKTIMKSFPKVVNVETEYSFDQEILKKYINEISEALQNANIPEKDLLSLIVKKEVYQVKKGSIHTLINYKDKIEQVYGLISPIISMR